MEVGEEREEVHDRQPKSRDNERLVFAVLSAADRSSYVFFTIVVCGYMRVGDEWKSFVQWWPLLLQEDDGVIQDPDRRAVSFDAQNACAPLAFAS
jgi:hypothetical protein